MTFKQKINLWAGNLIRVFSPRLMEKIQDKRALERYAGQADAMDWKLAGYGKRTFYSASGLQAGNLVVVGGGYKTFQLDTSRIASVYDLNSREWWTDIPIPSDAAETHHAVACEANRYLYWLGGQLGPGVHPCTAVCYRLDLQTREWDRLPDFPQPMYGPTAQYYKGRIHVVGGCHRDRKTTATIHWSLPVRNGQAQESSWSIEAETPQEGTHRGSAVIGDFLYLAGGQIGETPPAEGDDTYTYTPHTGTEEVFPHSVRYSFKDNTWQSIAPMPVGVSHHDCTTLVHEGKMIVVGGMEYQDEETHEIFLTDVIQEYDPASDQWRELGRLVYRMKSMVCAIFEGDLYVFGGQRDTSHTDARPSRFMSSIWKAPLK